MQVCEYVGNVIKRVKLTDFLQHGGCNARLHKRETIKAYLDFELSRKGRYVRQL